MSALRAITTVYSYYLPEVRAVVDELAAEYPHDVFLRSVDPGLDDFHEPVIERLIAYHASDVPALSSFAHRYPTSGSEEGIREYMSLLALQGVTSIYMLRGDYEGYREVARTRGIEALDVDPDADPAALAPGHWFLSNPSARDGNLIDPAHVRAICDAGHRLFYDLSYLGSTGPAVYHLDHPNVAVAALSLSKTYGLFYYRIGFLLVREPVPALYANKWFKNVFNLVLAGRLIERLPHGELARTYKAAQADIVGAIRADTGIPLEPSDAFLLAHLGAGAASTLAPDARAAIERFRRGDGYRFCLTPYFLERERR